MVYRNIKYPYYMSKKDKAKVKKDGEIENEGPDHLGLSSTLPERKFETLKETFKKTLNQDEDPSKPEE